MVMLPIGVETRLERNALFRFADGAGQCVECIEGVIWITQARMPCDIVLTAGQRVWLTAKGKALVGPLNGRAVVRAQRTPCLKIAA